MFDDYVPTVQRAGFKQAAPLSEPPAVLRAAEEDGETYAGLCMNCRHRATCGHPKSPGGVWHCEDYE
jgi:hypothetical protein